VGGDSGSVSNYENEKQNTCEKDCFGCFHRGSHLCMMFSGIQDKAYRFCIFLNAPLVSLLLVRKMKLNLYYEIRS